MKLTKKAYTTQLFGFFFILMIISGLLLFLTFGMHYVLFDYGISEVGTIGKDLITPYDPSSPAITGIEDLETGYLGLIQYYDILFLVIILSMFIESTIAAISSRTSGFLSFFGFVTIGNVFLITLLSYGVQVRGWFLNEIVYNVILVSITAPIMTFFFNYSIYISIVWYAWLLACNQIDLPRLKLAAQEVVDRFKGRERPRDNQPDFENFGQNLENFGRGGQ